MSTTGTAIAVLQGLLGIVMVGSGGSKLVGVDFQVEEFERYGFPGWFRLVTGSVEVFGGLGLLVGLFALPILAVLGGLLITATMAGGVLTHLLRTDDPPSASAKPGLFFLVGLAVTAYRAIA